MSNFITAFVFSMWKQIVPINTSTEIFFKFHYSKCKCLIEYQLIFKLILSGISCIPFNSHIFHSLTFKLMIENAVAF